MKSQGKYALLPSYDELDIPSHHLNAKKAKMPSCEACEATFKAFGAWLFGFICSLASLPSRIMLCVTAFGIYQLKQRFWTSGASLIVISMFGFDRDIQSLPLVYTAFLLIAINICVLAAIPSTWTPTGAGQLIGIAISEATLMAIIHKCYSQLQVLATQTVLAAATGDAADNDAELTSMTPAAGSSEPSAEQTGDLISEEQQVESNIGSMANDS